MNLLKYVLSWKYRMFSKKIRDVRTAIEEQKFKIAKSRQIREGVRQDRERVAQAVFNLDEALKNEKDKDRIAKMTEERAANAEAVTRYEKQMQMIDNQINGVPASGDQPGEQGILDTIASLTELLSMYKEYRETI